MNIAVYTAPKTLEVREHESIEILGENQVRVKSLFSGISHGTEMGVYRGVAPFFSKQYDPAIRLFVPANAQDTWQYPIRSCDPGVWYLGYSVCGEVIETGDKVTTLSVGDKVYINASHQSEHCVDADKAVKLPNSLDPRYGVFITNLMTAFNGILDSDIKLGDVVVIMGQGVIGQLTAQLAKLSGGIVYVVDTIDKRLEASTKIGADETFNPMTRDDIASVIREKTSGRGADIVIDATGSSKALQQAIRIAAPESKVIALSWYQGDSVINFADEFHHNRITIRCSQANFTRPDFAHIWTFERKLEFCTSLLSKLDLETLITNEYPFEQIQTAYEKIDTHPEEIIQCVLSY